MADRTAPQTRERDVDLLFSYIAGWAALVLAILLIHRIISVWMVNERWVLRGAIILLALVATWLWGYGPRLGAGSWDWVRRGGLNAALVVVALLVGAGMLNWIAARRHWEWDLTKNKRYTLSDRTRQVLNGLRQDVKVTAFFPGRQFRSTSGLVREQAQDLLKQYASASPRFKFQLKDPFVDAIEFQQLGLKQLDAAVLEMGDKRQDVLEFTEKALTGTLIKLTRDTKRKILFLTGHGELPYEGMSTDPRGSLSTAVSRLREVQWTIDPVSLYGKQAPAPDPAEVAAIIIAGPRRELDQSEIKHLNEYLNKGGRVLVTLDAGGPSLQAFLKDWGVEVGNDLVFDRFERSPLFVVEQPEQGKDLTRGIARTLHGRARTVTPASQPPSGATVTPLIKTEQERTIIIPNFDPHKPVSLASPANKNESATVAVVAEKTLSAPGKGEAKSARLVVFGDSLFATDQLVNFPTFFNGDLVTNTLNWLGEEEALVSIEPKEEVSDQIFVADEKLRLFAALHLLDFPLLAIGLGIFIYLRRR
ncbi:MAG: GldG family protein [Armatimonadetes bacterium]|nr:GldG family protein [Armatimonadota bacterium]